MQNAYLVMATPPVDLDTKPQQYDMVVFCHLRWDFVYQRPQHIISRMARTQKVLLIEEPIRWEADTSPTGRLRVISENLHVLQPQVDSIDAIREILPQFVANTQVATGWFYSAAFVSLLDAFEFATVVYDCMDELTLFRHAPEQLIAQETLLLSNADVVFTGGKSLYESKRVRHYNVHCFPSSVDREHFGKSLNGISVPEDVAGISGPIVGYFGVIDERIDLELLRQTALLQPDVSFVMIGPLAKIEDHDLPRRDNIYYLGMKPYEQLPNYLKAFSIAMMPFALNEATRFISPTKTLEYMAAGRPIISTAVTDVVRDYSGCVAIIESAAEFADVIGVLLAESATQEPLTVYESILDQTSWDRTVNRMQSIISIAHS